MSWIRQWLYLKRCQKILREGGIKMTMHQIRELDKIPLQLPIAVFAGFCGQMTPHLNAAAEAAKESAALFNKLRETLQ